ncbi:MAG: hypothetical protein HFI87_05135 [Bacilli bacterium]|nr:hypothetical protein [Bacilli bacterium]
MLEITISESEKLLLERAGFQNVISFCLLSSYGNIKNLLNQEYKAVDNITIAIDEQINKLKTSDSQKVRIWYSSLDNESVCNLYFLISWFYEKKIEISICDVMDLNHFSLGSYNENEVPALVSKTIYLTLDEMKEYNKKWNLLVNENSDLRIIEKNTIISVPFTYLDTEILKILSKYEKIKYWSLIGECMKERVCGFYADIFFSARVNTLIEQNVIEICEIKNEKNLIGEIKETKYIRIKK